jgi:hypothetical protein
MIPETGGGVGMTTASMQLKRCERFADYPFCARLADEEGAARQ